MKKILKKTLATFLSVAALASAAVIPNTSAVSQWTVGDVDYNNIITEYDARLILRYYTEVYVAQLSNPHYIPKSRADVNGDNIVDLTDAQLVLMFIDYANAHNIPKTSWYFYRYLANSGNLWI